MVTQRSEAQIMIRRRFRSDPGCPSRAERLCARACVRSLEEAAIARVQVTAPQRNTARSPKALSRVSAADGAITAGKAAARPKYPIASPRRLAGARAPIRVAVTVATVPNPAPIRAPSTSIAGRERTSASPTIAIPSTISAVIMRAAGRNRSTRRVAASSKTTLNRDTAAVTTPAALACPVRRSTAMGRTGRERLRVDRPSDVVASSSANWTVHKGEEGFCPPLPGPPPAGGRGIGSRGSSSVDEVRGSQERLVLLRRQIARARDRVALLEPARPELVDGDRALSADDEAGHALTDRRRLLESGAAHPDRQLQALRPGRADDRAEIRRQVAAPGVPADHAHGPEP